MNLQPTRASSLPFLSAVFVLVYGLLTTLFTHNGLLWAWLENTLPDMWPYYLFSPWIYLYLWLGPVLSWWGLPVTEGKWWSVPQVPVCIVLVVMVSVLVYVVTIWTATLLKKYDEHPRDPL